MVGGLGPGPPGPSPKSGPDGVLRNVAGRYTEALQSSFYDCILCREG